LIGSNQSHIVRSCIFMRIPSLLIYICILVPLILKGVQRWEVSIQSFNYEIFLKWVQQDALKAYDLGLAGVVLSNHGGRQLDFARSGIEVLVEVVAYLKEKRGLSFPNEKFQLFVDGGVRRATDVLKAIALGATAGKNVFCSVTFKFKT
jgi:L-lactate dehydrogenase (cytochrome)